MDKASLRVFKEKLEKERFELLMAINTEEIPDDGRGDEMDKAVQAGMNKMNKQLAERNQKRLQAVEGALDKIHAGSYGKCSDCEEDIEIRRLQILPMTERCIECAETLEDMKRRFPAVNV